MFSLLLNVISKVLNTQNYKIGTVEYKFDKSHAIRRKTMWNCN